MSTFMTSYSFTVLQAQEDKTIEKPAQCNTLIQRFIFVATGRVISFYVHVFSIFAVQSYDLTLHT